MTCPVEFAANLVSTIIDLGVSPPANSLYDVPTDNIEKFPY